MVLGDSDLKQINGRVSKIYKKVVGKRELLKKNLDSSGKYLDEALDKLCMLKNTLDEIRPFSKSEDTYKPYKQYVKVMRNSLSSMLEEFDSGMKLKTTGFLKEFLLKYTHFFHHLTMELKYLFPNGQMTSSQTFGRPYAQEWWCKNFGSE
ncbi:unnamed protein product [Hymenolepis diminuta]|nr:unnamed protein product [Hymenolepis diminuta]